MAQSRRAENELNISIGEYLEKEGYSDAFRDDYLIVSSSPHYIP